MGRATFVKKEELAQAVAACDLDPSLESKRSGSEPCIQHVELDGWPRPKRKLTAQIASGRTHEERMTLLEVELTAS